jgi:HSP20 family protein
MSNLLKKEVTMALIRSNRTADGSTAVLDRQGGLPSLFNDILNDFWTPRESQWMPAVNVTERADEYTIDLAVPGMEKNDFRVEIDNGVLTISGERKEENKAEGDVYTRREFHYGSFMRTFTLPEDVNGEKVSASYKNGILSITVAKKEEAKRKPKKMIDIK